ncbi:hypothetical protein [Spirosoma flavum]|uniref:Uncharacterized protein n=1 Tax=Spirosoma flavum TaxID=2048557 RepID=A0ABW6APJ1_9BACT
MSLSNRFGFILFSPTGPEPPDLLSLPDGNAFAPSASSVILVPAETYSFYLPFDVGLGLASANLDLVSDVSKAVVLGNIGSLTQINVGAGPKHYTATITIPANVGTILEVYYRLQINLTNGLKLYSNRLWLKKSGFSSLSAVFSYRNRKPVGPIAYDLIELDNFRNILRLKCVSNIPQTETESEEYENITTGVKVTVETHTHVAIPIICPNTDALGHEGWRTLCAHKDILINGRPFSIKTGYSEGEGMATLSTGTFQVWETQFSVINRC